MISELFQLYMRVNYGDYFHALGFNESYYDPAKNEFNEQAISDKIGAILSTWKAKYPRAEFRTYNLRFDSLVNFNFSFTNEVATLNMDV
jgi:hypothetical protein